VNQKRNPGARNATWRAHMAMDAMHHKVQVDFGHQAVVPVVDQFDL
jgi:hypothetical protein